MSQQTYNGWTGKDGSKASAYATWRVNLELGDDLIESYQQNARDYAETFADVSAIAERLKDDVEEIVTRGGELEGLAVDYAMAFLSGVDYYEIAEHAVASYPHLIAEDEEDREE